MPETGVHNAWLAAAVTVFLWSREERADALRAIVCGVPAAARARAHGAGMPVEVDRASSPKLLLVLFRKLLQDGRGLDLEGGAASARLRSVLAYV